MKHFPIARTGEKCFAVQKKNSAAGIRPLWRTAILLFGFLFAFEFSVRAQQNFAPTEYQLKAAYLYNFVKFVEWPTQAFESVTSPIVIKVFGKNVFGDNLEKAVRDKVINHHPLQFKIADSPAEATNCQVLFISASEKKHFPEILEALHGKSILTVSESDHFIKDGGMINFVIVDRRIRFQINNRAARQAGLIISSELLSLAVPSG